MRVKAVVLVLLVISSLANQVYSAGDTKSSVGTADRRIAVDAATDSLIALCVRNIDSTRIHGTIQNLVNFKTRFMLADNRRDIAVWIENKFRSYGYSNVVMDSFQNTLEYPLKSGSLHTTWQYNVYATLEGSEKSDSLFVLGAHYDCLILGPGTDPFTFSPGADNNASGMAVCLEVARIMMQRGVRPRCSILFAAFGAEEFMTMFAGGMSGSEYYVDKLIRSGQKVIMMIDNNQVGCSPSAAPWKIDFQNCPGSLWVTDLAHFVCGRYTHITPVDTNDHIDYTDARYFWNAGFPTIFFEEFHFSPDNFSPHDVPENINIAYCTEAAKISLAMLIYCSRR